MKCPTLTTEIRADPGSAATSVGPQIVSTNEALLDRRLAVDPRAPNGETRRSRSPARRRASRRSDPFLSDQIVRARHGRGGQSSVMAGGRIADGDPVVSREAAERRDDDRQHYSILAAGAGRALDQILHCFGADQVAEVTGRTRRIVVRQGRFCVETVRPPRILRDRGVWTTTRTDPCLSDAVVNREAQPSRRPACRNRRQTHSCTFSNPGPACRLPPSRAWVLGTGPIRKSRRSSTCRRRRQRRKAFPLNDRPAASTRRWRHHARQRQTGGQAPSRANDNLESAYAKAAFVILPAALRGLDRRPSARHIPGSTGLPRPRRSGRTSPREETAA